MATKAYLLTAAASIVIVFLVFKISLHPTTKEIIYRTVSGDGKSDELFQVTSVLIQQRNNMSRQLNLKQQKIGQLQCEKLKTVREATSESGGWCESSSKEDSGHHATDKKLASALADFFKGKSVASFGDGPGRYKQLILDSGKVKGYDAYDGAPYCDVTSNGRVKFLDLTLQQFGLPIYDWIMSLEVAEHIPAKFESVYIDNIVRHTKEGIVLSWAVPGQGGYSHVNLRTLEYVIKLMDSLGFSHDPEASKKLRSVSTLPWLQKNVNVYRRRDLSDIERQETFFL